MDLPLRLGQGADRFTYSHTSMPFSLKDDESAIRAMAEAWSAGWLNGHAGALAALYSADAVLIPENQPVVRGRDAILSLYESVFHDFAVTGGGEVMDLAVDGDLGYFWSTYRISATARGGGAERLEDSGNSIFVVRREADGAWRITHLISNSDRAVSTQ